MYLPEPTVAYLSRTPPSVSQEEEDAGKELARSGGGEKKHMDHDLKKSNPATMWTQN